MSKHRFISPPFNLPTPGTSVLLTIMGAGLVAAIYRFILGLGATTNLSDQFPWGIWVAFDVVCGVALAAGGFTTAAVVDIFGGERYHGLLRPAILTGFLGYVFVAIGLIVDLGLPWHIYHPIIFWPKHSALFEVAWCVMLYLSVLALEFMPSVFERFKWTKLYQLYKPAVRVYVVLALSWFSYIMSHNWMWAALAFVVLSLLAVLLPRLVKGDTGVPIMLVIAGVIFSTAHQSSLGTLFLLMPDKLNHLWWTPMLPVNFFLSALAVGFAMVIFESTLSSRAYKLPPEDYALTGLSKILAGALVVYLLVRVADLAIRGQLSAIFSGMGLLLICELTIGVIIPIVMLSSPRIRTQTWPRFIAAACVVFGLIFNRFNVTIFAMERNGQGFYFPSIEEILVTAAIIAALIFFFGMMVRMFPVLADTRAEESTKNIDMCERSA